MYDIHKYTYIRKYVMNLLDDKRTRVKLEENLKGLSTSPIFC